MVACLSLDGEGLDVYEIFPFTALTEEQEPYFFSPRIRKRKIPDDRS